MESSRSSKAVRDHPLILLFAIFLAWKLCLLLITLASPGGGYDTSTSLLFDQQGSHNSASGEVGMLGRRWFNFVRWDAVYFTHMSQHGHVYEQEWAFGMGLSTAISGIARLLSKSFSFFSAQSSVLIAGLALSHLAHWLSVIQLFALATTLTGSKKTTTPSLIPFYAAAFHILSPAGVFLSAPYTESLFAFFSISGFLAFVRAVHHSAHGPFTGCIGMIGAGIAFGTATFVRSNGILAGITFVLAACATAFAILSQGPSLPRVSLLASVLVGGLLVAVGMVTPQVVAYMEYCNGRYPGQRRPWCEANIPSIFTWVQSHYWNVGPFRYWTLSNVPLFLLAAPTLWLLVYSAIDVLRNPGALLAAPSGSSSQIATAQQKSAVMSLALPQLVLAVLALTSYHVQIITRISSGYPLWYIWLAARTQENTTRTAPIIRWMVIYALVQAGLYASFLPPA
ncbi:hypothetical protein A1O1_00378 [Capronia coronata CBS 617.96]|uniref:GPI mannosyltransferase 2 n=1 Tax=Capronia coronata CBS 617.96 TaxID=1182541 RepID=W9YRR0_9EURO|nr:uncharacterized protein A1O1_00378 [Capronia coronata CBS 617.96]EXJ95258.1 hypothetical protein A1O1_00378 [Capronia coronata CBS 617.96]